MLTSYLVDLKVRIEIGADDGDVMTADDLEQEFTVLHDPDQWDLSMAEIGGYTVDGIVEEVSSVKRT